MTLDSLAECAHEEQAKAIPIQKHSKEIGIVEDESEDDY